MILAGASAYAREIDFAEFREIADEVGAYLMVDMAHIAGLVAAGLHQSPVPVCGCCNHHNTQDLARTSRRSYPLQRGTRRKEVRQSRISRLSGRILLHAPVIAAKAVCLKEALSPEFKAYQLQVKNNAAKLAQELMTRDLDIVSGGTDNHLMLVSLLKQDKTGKESRA